MVESARKFLLAEYCPGNFYTGWWIYERDTNDGRRNAGWGDWGWLRDAWSQNKVRNLCCGIGSNPTPVTAHGQQFSTWFAATFPNGIEVTVDEWHDYTLVQVCQSRPRQRRRNIRTMRGAAMADRAMGKDKVK